MIKSYTIASDTPAELLSTLERAQITLNSRMHPSKRNSLELIDKVRRNFKGELFIHYDFIYIASRYHFLSDGTKRSIIHEISNLLSPSTSISGVVMHTDFPLRKEIFVSDDPQRVVDEVYSKPLFNKVAIVDSLELSPSKILEKNLNDFLKDLASALGNQPAHPLYLENTTKTSGVAGSYQHIVNYVNSYQDQYPFLGMCYDTEHAYADSGVDFEIPAVKNLLVHLNPIPSGVAPKSKKDQHSVTTLSECSAHSEDFYRNFIQILNDKKIPYIRECYQETIYREQEQIITWQL